MFCENPTCPRATLVILWRGTNLISLFAQPSWQFVRAGSLSGWRGTNFYIAGGNLLMTFCASLWHGANPDTAHAPSRRFVSVRLGLLLLRLNLVEFHELLVKRS